MQIGYFESIQSNSCNVQCTHVSCNHFQLFHFEFGRRIFPPAISYFVRVVFYQLMLYPYIKILHVVVFFSRLPFNMKSWRGYIFAFLLESAGSYAACAASVNFLCIFIGSSWILTSMAKDVTNDLRELNLSKSSKSSNNDQCKVQGQFSNISKRLSDVKQLSKILK